MKNKYKKHKQIKKAKVNFALEQAMKSQRVSRGIVLLVLDLSYTTV
jgi:hypothetical protein